MTAKEHPKVGPQSLSTEEMSSGFTGLWMRHVHRTWQKCERGLAVRPAQQRSTCFVELAV